MSWGQASTSLPITPSHMPCPWSLAEELVTLGRWGAPGSWSCRSWGRRQPNKPSGVWGPASSAGPWAQPSSGFLPSCPLPPVLIPEPALHPLMVCGCESECAPKSGSHQCCCNIHSTSSLGAKFLQGEALRPLCPHNFWFTAPGTSRPIRCLFPHWLPATLGAS